MRLPEKVGGYCSSAVSERLLYDKAITTSWPNCIRWTLLNGEIRIGLMRSLLPGYLAHNTLKGNTTIARMYLAIAGGDMDGALRLLQEFLSTVPYCDNTNYEGHYQQLFYIIFSLFGMYVDVEVLPPRGVWMW